MPAQKGQKYKPRTRAPIFNQVLVCARCPRKFKRNHSQHKYCARCRPQAKAEQTKEWRQNNIDTARGYSRSYYSRNTETIIAKTKSYSQTEQGRIARRTAEANQQLHNAKKVAARQIVRMALRGGILTRQPCNHCGSLKVEAHHEDYDKPLEVLWLCFIEHRRLHRERQDGPSTRRDRDKNGRFAAED